MRAVLFVASLVVVSCYYLADAAVWKFNHAGRILRLASDGIGVVNAPTLFNTATADTILSTLQIMPVTNSWNEDVSRLPLASNSDAIITQTISDLQGSRRYLDPEYEMNFLLVPTNQATTQMKMVNYPDESDQVNQNTEIGSYPFTSTDLPLEGWPRNTGATTMVAYQSSCAGDCHAIIVQPNNGPGYFWEAWQGKRTGNTPAWQAANLAMFNLSSNALRTPGITSGDAAGLAMFPSLVRYDECALRGAVEHAVRIVVAVSRNTYFYPANHKAGSQTSVNYAAMGTRFRLKSSFTAPAGWTKCEKAVVAALKKYGGIVADNGSFFSFSVTPDNRYASGEFQNLKTIAITNFEVVDPGAITATSGPRSPGAFSVNVASNQLYIGLGRYATLSASVTPASASVQYYWHVYEYPGDTTHPSAGTVTFNNPTLATTDAIFSAAGEYTLVVEASDGVHATSYASVTVVVTAGGTGGIPGGLPSSIATGPGTGGAGETGLDGAGNRVSAVTWVVMLGLMIAGSLSIVVVHA